MALNRRNYMNGRPDYNRKEELKARRDGAELVKNSGRGMRKGDAKYQNFKIDYKFTEAKSFTLNIDKFKSHEKDAWREGFEGCFVTVFDKYNEKAIAIVDWDILKSILDDYDELKFRMEGLE